ncbi:MAG: PilZ domain-containing protein [Acidobacteriota bacterium]
MKTVLDLVGEFAFLNDAKVRCGGYLARGDEKRWAELRDFYGLLMSRSTLAQPPVPRPWSADDIRQKVKWRDRLRVPADIDVLLRHRDEHLASSLTNLSCRGAFLASTELLPLQSHVWLFLGNAYGSLRPALELAGEVAWVNKVEFDRAALPRGMGIRFVRPRELILPRLDAVIIEALERRLASVGADTHPHQFFVAHA